MLLGRVWVALCLSMQRSHGHKALPDQSSIIGGTEPADWYQPLNFVSSNSTWPRLELAQLILKS